MTYWIISLNSKEFDFFSYLEKFGFLDLAQHSDKVQNDDVLFIYDSSKKKIVSKSSIFQTSFDFDQSSFIEDVWHDLRKKVEFIQTNQYFRVKQIQPIDTDLLSSEFLVNHGFVAQPDIETVMPKELVKYLASVIDSENEIDRKRKAVEDALYEGGTTQVLLDRLERNPTAKKACLERYGNDYTCQICGFNFEEAYGELGKNYIQVHHIKRLADERNRHKIDFDNLIPVCPNCHAMLHRKKGEPMPIEDLKKIIEERRKMRKTK